MGSFLYWQTGNSLAFFLYNLASSPDKQEALYEEITRVLPNKQQPTAQAFKNMPYLKAALKESFRYLDEMIEFEICIVHTCKACQLS
jgi:hypothetical protein